MNARQATVAAVEDDAKRAHLFRTVADAIFKSRRDDEEPLKITRLAVTNVKAALAERGFPNATVSFDDSYGMLYLSVWGIVGFGFDNRFRVFCGYSSDVSTPNYKVGITKNQLRAMNPQYCAAADTRLAAARAWLATDAPERLDAARQAVEAATAVAKALEPTFYSI